MSELNLALWQTRFGEYLSMRHYSGRTVVYYTTELRHFFPYLETHGVHHLVGITTALVEGYRAVLYNAEYRGRRLSFSTQSHRLMAVRKFTKFLWRERCLSSDPGAAVELPKQDKPLPRVLLSETDVMALLQTPDTSEVLGLRDRTILEVFYATGIRNSELGHLELDAVDLQAQQLSIRRGKGSKDRIVPLGAAATHWLDQYLREGRPCLVSDPVLQFVFVSYTGLVLDRGSLAQVVCRAAEKAGLAGHITPHVLRLACATHMLARGAGLRHLQDLLGHVSPETTHRYTRVEISDLKAVHRRFHPREQPASETTDTTETGGVS